MLFVEQARWRGAIVRKRITSVRQEYELIFSEIEETPSCCIEWRDSCIRRPQFELLDRRIKVHHNKDQHGNKTSQQTSDCISLADQDSAKSTNDKLYVSDSKVESHTKTECISDSSGTLDQHVDSVNTLPAGDSQQVVSTLQSPEINTEHLTVHIDEIKPGDGRLPAENIDDKLTAIENGKIIGVRALLLCERDFVLQYIFKS